MARWLDVGMLLGFLVVERRQVTGVPVHEWLAVAVAVIFGSHLLWNWAWVRDALGSLPTAGWRPRVNLALNLSLFLALVAAVFSGLMISEAVVPSPLWVRDAGVMATHLRWRSIHELSSHLMLVLAGLHLALNWDAVRRLLRTALPGRRVVGTGRAVQAPRGGATAGTPGGRLARPAARLAALLLVAGAVAGSLYALGAAIPLTSAEQEEGRTIAASLGADPASARPHEPPNWRPAPLRLSLPAVAAALAVFAGTAWVGRVVLRLRP